MKTAAELVHDPDPQKPGESKVGLGNAGRYYR